jgi:hypothetical protein
VPELPFSPARARYLGGFTVAAKPIARNLAGRRRKSVEDWLAAIEAAASSFAKATSWADDDRYCAVIEVRLLRHGDIDNYIKDLLDRSAQRGVFGGQDGRVDLVHAIKRQHVPEGEAGARMEVWMLGAPPIGRLDYAA